MTAIQEQKRVEYGRQTLILDPATANKLHVTVFGCGTVGSNAAVECARLGVGNFTLYDFDEVEPHNVPSQRFVKDDIGRKKVHALADQIAVVSNDSNIVTVDKKVDAPVMLKDGIFILAVDSMESRKYIAENILAYATGGIIMDFRMSGNLLQCYCFEPGNADYLATLFDDKDAEPAPCGGRTVSYTGALSGCIAANYARKHLNGDEVPFFTGVDLDAVQLMRSPLAGE